MYLMRIGASGAEKAVAQPGDLMEPGVDGLGSQRQHVVPPR